VLADKYDAMVMVDECHATGCSFQESNFTNTKKGVMGE
jgi:7-keto-8-aminopelargonate synthetase-like enzyme